MSTSFGKIPSREDLSYLFDNEKNAIKLLQQLGVFATEKKKHIMQIWNTISQWWKFTVQQVSSKMLFL